jgi:hypothetical protein
VLVDANREQCETTLDCANRGAEFANYECVNKLCTEKAKDPAWACLGDIKSPTSEPRQVTVTIAFQHLATRAALAGVSTKICEKFDANCTTPIFSDLLSGADGTLTFKVNSGFSGYATFVPPNGQMPGSYYFYPPITEDRIVPPIPLIELELFITLAKNSGIEVQKGRGHVFLAAYNCKGEVSSGINLSVVDGDPAIIPFYIIEGLPTAKATSTDAQGWGGLVNLRPGNATVFGKLPAQDMVQIGKVGVVIKPDEISYTALHPSE